MALIAKKLPVDAPDFVLASDPKVQNLEISTTSKPEFRGVSVSEQGGTGAGSRSFR